MRVAARRLGRSHATGVAVVWAGPVYGLVVWLGFELGIAPVLGLSQAKRVRPVDRLALAGDRLLFGLVLTATRPNERSNL